jgi:hypothetical protein
VFHTLSGLLFGEKEYADPLFGFRRKAFSSGLGFDRHFRSARERSQENQLFAP